MVAYLAEVGGGRRRGKSGDLIPGYIAYGQVHLFQAAQAGHLLDIFKIPDIEHDLGQTQQGSSTHSRSDDMADLPVMGIDERGSCPHGDYDGPVH